jgi:hypothetical protein
MVVEELLKGWWVLVARRDRRCARELGGNRAPLTYPWVAELPAAILARLLGIHIGVAVKWQRASSGD